ncbi:hypothetical protein RKD18_007646 [Streptomyces phaeoluteigriseus]
MLTVTDVSEVPVRASLAVTAPPAPADHTVVPQIAPGRYGSLCRTLPESMSTTRSSRPPPTGVPSTSTRFSDAPTILVCASDSLKESWRPVSTGVPGKVPPLPTTSSLGCPPTSVPTAPRYTVRPSPVGYSSGHGP